MIGLEKEIEIRRKSKILERNELISYSSISKIIKKPYNTTKRKIQNGALTIDEAFNIYNSLKFKAKSKFEAFKYLFTEQDK